MKKYPKIIFSVIGFLLLTLVVYATVTTASSRKSTKLPWQGTPTGFYDSAHNVGTSYLADTRFVFDSGTTPGGISVVKDNTTGLYWQSEGVTQGTKTWANAITYCDGLTLGGYTDWRLPTFKELESIIDLTRHSPSINTSFFSSVNTVYWSSTTYAYNTANAWLVRFSNGSSSSTYKTDSYYVRCIR